MDTYVYVSACPAARMAVPLLPSLCRSVGQESRLARPETSQQQPQPAPSAAMESGGSSV